jgi:catechol 2,3-dioxygenase-like lactoylglutathione lyase family enzyme
VPTGTSADRPLDYGLTHVALTVRDLDASVAFYTTYCAMEVVHRRVDEATGDCVAWVSDLTRPFIVVLIQADVPTHPLAGWNHLGIGVDSRAEVDEVARRGRAEGLGVSGPIDHGPPVGYVVIVADPDGHNVEFAHGQEVAFVVRQHETA